MYDFPLLFAEVDRRYPLLTNKLFSHIRFGDSLANIRTVSYTLKQKTIEDSIGSSPYGRFDDGITNYRVLLYII